MSRFSTRIRPVSNRENSKAIRHGHIRRILARNSGADGISSYEEMRQVLADEGVETSVVTLKQDFAELGAIKLKDEHTPSITWWIIPAYNPALENLRNNLPVELIENQVAVKVVNHVVDAVVIDSAVHIMTETRAGYLVAYWIAWLPWEGIIRVQEQLDGCIVYCADGEVASMVRARLLGEEVPDDPAE